MLRPQMLGKEAILIDCSDCETGLEHIFLENIQRGGGNIFANPSLITKSQHLFDQFTTKDNWKRCGISPVFGGTTPFIPTLQGLIQSGVQISEIHVCLCIFNFVCE